ncbi:MAG TPA: patatin-like phospholipase family protein [Alphaproteobacteria bacterium]|nr:patatin-like phospholipase family protein [Alphaproteobacteria bacterium]
MGIALVLGGGAPNMTMMAGALLEFDRAGVKFDVVSTAGAGMLIGLLYAAPKDLSRQEALRRTKDLGVSDLIYKVFPVNFKVFHKPGALAEMYTRAAQLMRPPRLPESELERFWLDWWRLMVAAACPTDLSYFSKGLCQPAPWIESVVDFEKLQKFEGDFYLSAYCIEDQEHVLFQKDEIDAHTFRAALAMPFIYEPFKMNGKTYLEGAAQDALNYKGLIETVEAKEFDIDTIVVFDVLGTRKAVREPRNLYDAWVKSIIVPLVEIARDDTRLFDLVHNRNPDGSEKRRLLRVGFDEFMPESQWDKVYDWSYSNLSTLFDVGREAALAFLEEHHELLEGRSSGGERDAASNVTPLRP